MSGSNINCQVLLRKVALFKNLSDESISFLGSRMRPEKFLDGMYLIQEGELGERMFVLTKGELDIIKITPSGEVFKVARLTADLNPAVGEGALIVSEPRSASARCVGAVECMVLHQTDFNDFCDQYPREAVPLMKDLMMTLMQRLKKTSGDLILLHKALIDEIRG